MEDEDVEAIFKKSPKEKNPLYMQEMSKAKKRGKSDYLGIVKRNPSFDGQQTMILKDTVTFYIIIFRFFFLSHGYII